MLDTFHASEIPSLPKECPDSSPALDGSLHGCVSAMREHMHAGKWIFSIGHTSACVSNLLACEETMW